MLKQFDSLFVDLVYDDENDPQETLIEYLKDLYFERRIECLRYLIVEHGNGLLDTLHQSRYENDSFLISPAMLKKLSEELPGEFSEIEFNLDFQGIIDNTVAKVRTVLEGYVPEALVKLELQSASISTGHSFQLQQARSILDLAESATAPAQVAVSPAVILSSDRFPQNGKKEIADLPHKDAAYFLKISHSKLHKLKDHVRHYKRPDSNTKWYRIEDLQDYVDKAYNRAMPPPDTRSSQPVRHNRKRKG